MSSGSDGLYLSTLSDMSPATSDCLGPYFPFFPPIIIALFVLTFLGSFISLCFFIICTLFGYDHGRRRSRQLDQYVRMLEGTE